MEHVPPRSIGGKVLCLTCRTCNSHAGHTIDAEVHRETELKSFLSRDRRTRRATIVVDGREARIELRIDESGFHIIVLGNQNDPKQIGLLEQEVQRIAAAEGEFKIRPDVSYSKLGADTGVLRSAYLAAFAKLGYSYILSPALNKIRQQIQNPCSRTLEFFRFPVSPDVTGKFLLLQEPIHCMAVGVADTVICLPLPFGDDLFYGPLAELLMKSQQIQCRANGTIQWPDEFELYLDTARVVKK